MTNDYTRRDFLATAAAGAALASLSSNSHAEDGPDINTNLSSAFGTVQEIKPLPFDPAKLDGISEKLIRSHWENNYAGSVVLHKLYFANLGGSGKPDAAVSKALNEAFGSAEAWEKEFKRIGAGLGGGSGWVVLGLNLHTGLLENYWQWDHATGPSSTLPILVLDMYEHSYQMDYGAAAGNYVDAFFRNIQWEVVASRLQKALKARAIWAG